MEAIDELKYLIRESSSPFFSEEELAYHLEQSGGDVRLAAYHLCLLKAEDDSITLPGGLSLPNNRAYWLSLAKRYRANQSKIL